jgi:hypothetical protein
MKKSTTSPAAEKPVARRTFPTVRDRLVAIQNAALLLEAATIASRSDDAENSSDDYIAAMDGLIRDIQEHAFWALDVADAHLDVDAPDQDQRERAERLAVR